MGSTPRWQWGGWHMMVGILGTESAAFLDNKIWQQAASWEYRHMVDALFLFFNCVFDTEVWPGSWGDGLTYRADPQTRLPSRPG
jgi:hypothetical protein